MEKNKNQAVALKLVCIFTPGEAAGFSLIDFVLA